MKAFFQWLCIIHVITGAYSCALLFVRRFKGQSDFVDLSAQSSACLVIGGFSLLICVIIKWIEKRKTVGGKAI